MGIPPVYSRESERNIRTYDAFDLATGRLVQTFFGGSTTANYLLADTKFYSDDVVITTTQKSNSALTVHINLNWEVEFQVPALIEGDAICSMALGGQAAAGGVITISSVATLYHVDVDNNATQLATETSNNFEFNDGSSTANSSRRALLLPITKQKIKVGEKLRLNIQVRSSTSASQNHYVGLGNSPNDLNDDSPIKTIEDSTPTVLQLQIPFIIKDL